MDCEEEQKNELEALKEIYYNEISVISDKTPISFSIRICSDSTNNEDYDAQYSDDEESIEDEETPQTTSVELLFTLPPNYPNERPEIEISESQNLEEHELIELLDDLNNRAEEYLGSVMVFMLVSDVFERIVRGNEPEFESDDEEGDNGKVESKNNDFIPITVQQFMEWKEKFNSEMSSIEEKRDKLSGREMFELDKTLAESDLNFVEDLDQSQIEALMNDIDEVELDDE